MLRFPDRPDALPLDLIRGFETTSKHKIFDVTEELLIYDGFQPATL
jgi:hypothetical protein